MPKHLIGLGRPTGNGWIRQEVGNFLVEATIASQLDPDLRPHIDQTLHFPYNAFPTDITRNVIVKAAQDKGVDILFMIDSDAAPTAGFFKSAILFLINHPEADILGAPYVNGDGKVQVFKHTTDQARDPFSKDAYPLETWKLSNISRDAYPFYKGIHRVANLGTHLFAIRMSAFKRVTPPYFSYVYNDDHTQMIGTEDIVGFNKLYYAGASIYCDFDHPAGHWKEARLDVPEPLPENIVPEFFRNAARAELLYAEKEYPTVHDDIPGWCDYPDLYEALLEQTPANGTFVEVGSYQGQSVVHLAEQARLRHKPIHIWAVDTFRGEGEEITQRAALAAGGSLRHVFDANLERYGVKPLVQVKEAPSTEAAQAFNDNSLDVCFIDAAHDYHSVKADITAWLPKVKPGGIIAGHDYDRTTHPAVVKAVQEAFPTGFHTHKRCWIYHKPTHAE